VALLAVSGSALGLMQVFATLAYRDGFSVPGMLTGRFLVTSSVIWALIIALGRPLPDRRRILLGLGYGGIIYAAQALFFYTALKRIDPAIATVVFYVYPALVFCVAVPLGRDRFTWARLVGVPFALVGVTLVAVGAGVGSMDGLGIALALAAAATYVVFVLAGDTIGEGIDPFVLAALFTTGALPTFVLYGLLTGGFSFAVTPSGSAWTACVGIVSVVAYLCLFAGLRRAGPTIATLLANMEPVVVVIASTLILGTSLTATQLVGAALVVGSVVVVNAIDMGSGPRPP
jgi:drug/metabolite transporter (DMT)-like permease